MEGKAAAIVILIQGKYRVGRQVSVWSGERCGEEGDLYWSAAVPQVTPEEDEGELGVVGADCGNAGIRR